MWIYSITAIGLSALLVASIVAGISGWSVGKNTLFPETCDQWTALISAPVNWVVFRNSFVALTAAFPLLFIRAVMDPLVHMIGSNIIRKSVTFGFV